MRQPDTAQPDDATGDAAPSRAVVGGRNLPLAIGVGLALAGLLLGTLFWHPVAFVGLVAALAVVAYLELGRVLRGVGLRIDVPVLILATMIMLFGGLLAGTTGIVVGVVVLMLGGALSLLSDASRRDVTRTLGTTMLFGLWVGVLASFAALLVDRPNGPVVVVAVVGAAIMSDIGGYALGVAIGRHKLAPVLSPNKTWEGLIGALLLPTVLAAALLPRFDDAFTPLSAALIAALVSLAAMIGDLVESMVKRDLGVKDLGDVLPGHGGVLDRVDGILFALPVGYLAIELLL